MPTCKIPKEAKPYKLDLIPVEEMDEWYKTYPDAVGATVFYDKDGRLWPKPMIGAIVDMDAN